MNQCSCEISNITKSEQNRRPTAFAAGNSTSTPKVPQLCFAIAKIDRQAQNYSTTILPF